MCLWAPVVMNMSELLLSLEFPASFCSVFWFYSYVHPHSSHQAAADSFVFIWKNYDKPAVHYLSSTK